MKSIIPEPRIRAGRIWMQMGMSHAASDCPCPVPPMKLVPSKSESDG